MSKTPNYVFDDELCHHGIIGQMWGRRRFQNEDGSWTSEGRERYGKGEDQVKKAKAAFKVQKQKAEIKSKKQQLKDKIAAKEERNRIKEQAKTARFAKKQQAKIDQQGQAKNALTNKLMKTRNMSDDDLEKAVKRLKLESEYNKNYYLAKHPDGALAKADRFFEGSTGKAVTQVAVAVLPNVANSAVQKLLESKLKYSNKEDREAHKLSIEKAKEDINKTKADTEKIKAEAAEKRAKANQAYQEIHAQEVEARKQKMFGNKDIAKESSNKTKASDNKTNISDVKSIVHDTRSVVDTGYRLYKMHSDKVSSAPVSSIKNSSSSIAGYLPANKSSSTLSMPVSNIAGYLPAKSSVLKKK